MTRILLHGARGRMGQAVAAIALETLKDAGLTVDETPVIVAGVDSRDDGAAQPFPIYGALDDVKEAADVVIDFTRPETLTALLTFARDRRTALVLATTGYDEADMMRITAASRDIAIFRSANYSVGVYVLTELARRAALTLSGCDVEIAETHHRTKLDAPSGTALALARAIGEANPTPLIPRYGRAPNEPPRQQGEMGIHAIRGGTAAGDHSVLFLMDGETIELTHRAHSRDVFARGALRAAQWVATKPAGLYGMNDMLDMPGRR
ncbi:MAG: 4-hydroxy-tetrahydrodipicolinate reductase [Oscillospiraceae bacterium]|nr:4-hydroxy-tetrahydrodipicolinate reductase [Oscillospiraceae bacterium]